MSRTKLIAGQPVATRFGWQLHVAVANDDSQLGQRQKDAKQMLDRADNRAGRRAAMRKARRRGKGWTR